MDQKKSAGLKKRTRKMVNAIKEPCNTGSSPEG
jgi:hypothetical protein